MKSKNKINFKVFKDNQVVLYFQVFSWNPISLPVMVVTKSRYFSQEKPKCKTFRVSFSDVTSMITFEKTPFEKEMTESEHDTETGYTLRNRQAGTDANADTVYSLRARPVRST